MSILRAIFAAEAAADTCDSQKPSPWLVDHFGGRRTSAGVTITPEKALSLSVYYACLHVISEDLGKLPLFVYRQTADGKKRLLDHPAYRLLHVSPNEDMGSMTFRETLTHHAMGWGGGFAEIIRDGQNRPVELGVIHPSRVEVKRDEDDRLVYLVREGSRGFKKIRFPAQDILHIHGLGPTGTTGYAMSVLAREAIALGLEAETFGASFFANSSVAFGVLEHPGTLTPEAHANLKSSLVENEHKGAGRAHGTLILEEGMKWEQTSIPPNDAQFLETRQFQVEDICRWFRVPPHKIQHLLRATFSNIESQAIEYVTDALTPWAVRWEQELARKLFRREPDVYAEHLFAGLLRGDQAQRSNYYRQMFSVGAMSINDILRKENADGIGPLGDMRFVPANMQRLEVAATAQPKATAPGPGSDQTGAPADDTGALKAAHLPLFEAAAARFMGKEALAVTRAARKHAGDPAAFENWANEFFAKHAEFVVDALEPPAVAFAMLADPSGGLGADQAVRKYAENYVKSTRADAVSAFGRGTVEGWCAARSNGAAAAAAAETIVEVICDANNATGA